MLKLTIIIGAHMVGVMAAYALPVTGRFQETMALQPAAGKLEMAGGASCPPSDIGIIVAPAVQMTAQATTPEHIVYQGEAWVLFLPGNVCQRGDGVGCPEVVPGEVDGLFQGQVQTGAAAL